MKALEGDCNFTHEVATLPLLPETQIIRFPLVLPPDAPSPTNSVLYIADRILYTVSRARVCILFPHIRIGYSQPYSLYTLTLLCVDPIPTRLILALLYLFHCCYTDTHSLIQLIFSLRLWRHVSLFPLYTLYCCTTVHCYVDLITPEVLSRGRLKINFW